MRVFAALVMVVLALGFGVVPEPATAVPCPGHDGASGDPGHAPHGRHAENGHGADDTGAAAAAAAIA
jgi:hypothetical protein